MGLTFLGWANNVGDFVADLAIAKDGYSRCAFSAAFAGPPLYLLASVGLACFVTSATHSFEPIPIYIENVEVVLFVRLEYEGHEWFLKPFLVLYAVQWRHSFRSSLAVSMLIK